MKLQTWRALPLDHQGHVEAEQEGEGQPRVHLAAPPHQLLKRQLHLLGHREPGQGSNLFWCLDKGSYSSGFLKRKLMKSSNETDIYKTFPPVSIMFPISKKHFTA